MALPHGIRAVLLDIEGTTTPLAFVHETLFPYARERLDAVLAQAPDGDPRIAEARRQLREEYERESLENPNLPPFGTGAPYAHSLMDLDRKSTGLKTLQGVIWEAGYRDGTLLANVFDDVPVALRAWKAAGILVRIYSSGSVLAQRLLFGHTQHGDLTPWIDGWHDTGTGPKREPSSYRVIAQAFGVEPHEVLFLSDAAAELEAASAAGLATGLLFRPGNPTPERGPHDVFTDFRPLLP